MTTIINYDAIVQELEKGLTHSEEMSGPCLGLKELMPKHVALREYYTVGMHLPRQTGTTQLVINELIKNPNATCVFVSEICSTMALNTIKEMVSAAKEDRKVSIRGVIYTDLDPVIKEHILKQPNLVADMEKRFITIRGLLKLMGDNKKFVNGMNRIYLDGAASVFTQVKRKKFYAWLGDHSESFIQTWVIN
jgi:hypothetical protein